MRYYKLIITLKFFLWKTQWLIYKKILKVEKVKKTRSFTYLRKMPNTTLHDGHIDKRDDYEQCGRAPSTFFSELFPWTIYCKSNNFFVNISNAKKLCISQYFKFENNNKHVNSKFNQPLVKKRQSAMIDSQSTDILNTKKKSIDHGLRLPRWPEWKIDRVKERVFLKTVLLFLIFLTKWFSYKVNKNWFHDQLVIRRRF